MNTKIHSACTLEPRYLS